MAVRVHAPGGINEAPTPKPPFTGQKVWLDTKLKERVDAHCRLKGITLTQFFRDAAAHHLGADPDTYALYTTRVARENREGEAEPERRAL